MVSGWESGLYIMVMTHKEQTFKKTQRYVRIAAAVVGQALIDVVASWWCAIASPPYHTNQ